MKILGWTLAFWMLLLGWSVASPSKIQILPFDHKALPKEIRYKGEMVAGARWLDKSGKNLLLLCETGPFKSPIPPNSKKIPIKSGAKPPNCMDIITSRAKDSTCYCGNFTTRSISAPLTLMRRFCPIPSPSPIWTATASPRVPFYISWGAGATSVRYQLKLIMHEGKAKYALRGETLVPTTDPDKKLGGQKTIDPAFGRAPKSFWTTPCSSGMPSWKKIQGKFSSVTVRPYKESK